MKAAKFGPLAKYNFVNYERGHAIAGGVVEGPTHTLNGNARWRVRVPCGHVILVEGIRLRAYEKRGGKLRCWECSPKRLVKP